jgi:hypothetical protein
LIESVYVLAYTFSLCLADEKTRDLQASWWMFEDPVAADEISYHMRFEQNTIYSSSLASESGIDQQFPLFCAFCFPMKLRKPLLGNKQGEKKITRTSSVLDILKGSMTFVWI